MDCENGPGTLGREAVGAECLRVGETSRDPDLLPRTEARVTQVPISEPGAAALWCPHSPSPEVPPIHIHGSSLSDAMARQSYRQALVA